MIREYLGVKVFEGTYSYRGKRIVPSWGGSMFEALMVTLFVPEDVWAPKSWGINHPLYVRAQIEHGLEEAGYGFWGFSPAMSPRGGYEIYGVKAIGTDPLGYLSYDIGRPAAASSSRPGYRSADEPRRRDTPCLVPRPALCPSRGDRQPPEAADHSSRSTATLGFQDSVDVSAGVVSGCVLALDQGMIMAAIANELADDAMQHAFSDGQRRAVDPPPASPWKSSPRGQPAGQPPSGPRRACGAEVAGLRPDEWSGVLADCTVSRKRMSCPSAADDSASCRLSTRLRDRGCPVATAAWHVRFLLPDRAKLATDPRCRRTNFHASIDCFTFVAPYAILCSASPGHEKLLRFSNTRAAARCNRQMDVPESPRPQA